MTLVQKKSLLLAAVLTAALAGCAGCEEPSALKKVNGEPKFQVTQPDGTTALAESITIDFGPVLLNDRVERKVTLRNDGRGPFQVSSITRGGNFDEAFRYQVEPFELNVGESRDISFFFEPTTDGDKVTDLTIDVKDGTVPTMSVKLQGRGVKGGCTIDPGETADFGAVATGTSFVKIISVKNSSDLDWEVEIGQISSQSDQGAFTFKNFQPGRYKVPAHDGLAVPVEFKPNHVGAHSAFLAIPFPSMCKPAVLPLTGNGVDQVLTWEPEKVDFGFVNPNTLVKSKVTFKNLGNKDVTVAGLAVENPAGKDQFSLDTMTTSFVVTANGGTQDVPLAFKPTLLGAQTAKLKFTTDDAKLTAGTVSLQGFGGGPDIDVSPAKVDFGPVAIGTFQYRRIIIANVGTDAPGTAEDNLHLASGKTNGVWKAKLATLEEITTPGAKEFELEWLPQGYTEATGIQAGQNVDLRVKFTPKSAGTKDAKITIYSNDPDEPELVVTVTAGGRTLPPCDYEIVPPTLPFGNVENGKTMTQSFHIKNRATNPADECLVSTLGFARNTPSAFSLVKGPVQGQIIPGGGTLEIPVKFAPKMDGQYNGAVEFYISSPTAPEGKVTLSGGSQAGCLLIAPNDLDFGVVQTGCASRERTFTVYNVCSTTITLQQLDVQTGLSTEFKVTQKPALPFTLTSGAQTEFKATYRPTDVGKDAGSIAVKTAQLTQPYVVLVQGRGDTTAIQTDVFAQDSQPKVDVLIVIDDSCSMSDKQNSLSTNFAAFIKFAVSQQVDYHIAVTTTDTGSSGSYNGRFAPLTGAGYRVITPTTPNKEAEFAKNVKVGISGSGSEAPLEAAYLALQSNLLQTHNAGFMRDEANLAVVFVTDAADQSTRPLTFYTNFFLNIKGFRRANQLSVSGIIPLYASAPAGSCSYDETSAGQSTRMRDIISRNGGIYDDICTPDWSKTLEKLGQNAFGYRTRFFLSNLPDMTKTDPIVVKVDGVPYPDVGPRGDTRWTYNSTANAIDFEALAVPEPGSTLTITYYVQCLP